MIMGGLALVFGFLAGRDHRLGWLWDSRREYAATEEADRTGHLDLGGAPAWPKATFAVLALIVGARARSQLRASWRGSGDGGGHGERRTGGASAAPGGGTTASEAPPAAPDADVVVVAENITWVETALTVPAGSAVHPGARQPRQRRPARRGDQGRRRAPWCSRGTWSRDRRLWSTMCPALPAGQYTLRLHGAPQHEGTVTAQ